jgi:biopolymer transport protein ExbB
MNALLSTSLSFVLALATSVQDNAAQNTPAASDAMSQVSSAAQAELAKSTAALNQLRDQVAAEKLPLAQELTKLEEQLSALRREHDQVTREVDEGNLQITAIKALGKASSDELSYVGNLLDEYARGFESKVNPCELQYCGEAVQSAKEATENTTLSQDERFARQTSFVDVSLKRLTDAVGGMRFPGTGVDLQGAVVTGQYAMLGPVALFCAASGVAGLVVPQTGSPNPLIRPLEGALQLGIANLVQSGEGLLPLDPMRGAALKALIQKTNLWHIFEKGGPIMWPLLLASILALGTVLERVVFLLIESRKRDSKAMERLFGDLERGDVAAALRDSAGSKDYVVRTLRYALEHKEQSLSSALLYAQTRELKRFQRGISILDTVITLAPLLGLLGTVTGMMGSFSLIGGELSAPGAITGGIAEALIATAFGLGIAITSLLPFNILNTKLDVARQEIESAASQLELLIQHPPAPAATATVAPVPMARVNDVRAERSERQHPVQHPVGAGKE